VNRFHYLVVRVEPCCLVVVHTHLTAADAVRDAAMLDSLTDGVSVWHQVVWPPGYCTYQ
jgi:hypothetical protein